jgi:hypothetical protein
VCGKLKCGNINGKQHLCRDFSSSVPDSRSGRKMMMNSFDYNIKFYWYFKHDKAIKNLVSVCLCVSVSVCVCVCLSICLCLCLSARFLHFCTILQKSRWCQNLFNFNTKRWIAFELPCATVSWRAWQKRHFFGVFLKKFNFFDTFVDCWALSGTDEPKSWQRCCFPFFEFEMHEHN